MFFYENRTKQNKTRICSNTFFFPDIYSTKILGHIYSNTLKTCVVKGKETN